MFVNRVNGKSQIKLFHCQELYDHIHAQQPHVLVSYKQGLLGTEDFRAPEKGIGKANRRFPWRYVTPCNLGVGAISGPMTASTRLRTRLWTYSNAPGASPPTCC
jgi:hypothetical protein